MSPFFFSSVRAEIHQNGSTLKIYMYYQFSTVVPEDEFQEAECFYIIIVNVQQF